MVSSFLSTLLIVIIEVHYDPIHRISPNISSMIVMTPFVNRIMKASLSNLECWNEKFGVVTHNYECQENPYKVYKK